MSAPSANPRAVTPDEEVGVEPVPEPPPTDPTFPFEAEFDAAVHTATESTRRVVVETGASVRRAVEQMMAEHGPLAAGLDERAPDPDGGWSWAVEYRRRADEAVLQPLLRMLREASLGETVSHAFAGAVETVRAYARELPESVDLADLTALYRIQASDSAWQRLVKRGERVRRAGRRAPRAMGNGLRRLVGRAPVPSPVDERHVPVRQLVEYHAVTRVAAVVASRHRVAQQDLAQALARVVNAVTEWTMRVVEIEQALDGPAYHQPATIRDRLPRPSAKDDSSAAKGDAENEAAEPAAGNAEADDGPDWTEALCEAARALQNGLAAVGEVAPEEVLPGEDLDRIAAALHADLSQAGTILLREARRVVPSDGGRGPRLERDGAAWGRWHERVVNRMTLNTGLLTLRDQLREIQDQLLRRLAGATVEPAFTVFDAIAARLQDGARRLEALVGSPETVPDLSRLAGDLEGLEEALARDLRRELLDVPGVVSAHQALADPGLPEWEQIVGLVAGLPDELPLNRSRPTPDAEIDPGHRAFGLDLREIAADALAPPLPHQLKSCVGPLRQRVVHVWDQAATIEEIVHFNFSATLDELAKVDDPSVDDPPSREAVLEHARELPAEAIRRSQDTLRELIASFAEPWYILADGVFTTFDGDWVDLQRRVDADRAMEERFLGYQTRLKRFAEREWSRTRERALVWRQRIARWTTVVMRWIRALIRRGQAVVGVAEVSDDESLAALDAIVDVPQLQAALPLVYRKLFAFEPVTEPALFEGRDRDLVRVRRHFDRWERRHDTGVVILSAPLGGGRTSVLNVLEEKVFEGREVCRFSLDRRVTDQDVLARLVAAAMGIPGEPTLDALEARLTSAPSARRRVCLVDNLEHLVFQGTGGTDLIERVLSFMARTDLAVYWVGTMARDAWQFVSKTTGSATGFVTHVELQPLTVASMTDVLMSRHSRSGIPLQFLAPENPGTILRQRLRRARTEERQQEILRREFFNALFDVSDQHIAMALLYWLRSADFESRPDALLLRPVQPLSFRFLDGLDLGRTFALKAFVLHNTLVPERLAGILRIPADETAFILESLLNQRIIEQVDEVSTGATGVVPGTPYRIRRFLLHPVIRYLRHRHIVY